MDGEVAGPALGEALDDGPAQNLRAKTAWSFEKSERPIEIRSALDGIFLLVIKRFPFDFIRFNAMSGIDVVHKFSEIGKIGSRSRGNPGAAEEHNLSVVELVHEADRNNRTVGHKFRHDKS